MVQAINDHSVLSFMGESILWHGIKVINKNKLQINRPTPDLKTSAAARFVAGNLPEDALDCALSDLGRAVAWDYRPHRPDCHALDG
jgi:hypothetical protein